MDKFILKALQSASNPHEDGYYTGKSYMYQGSKYAVVSKDKNEAKTYSTYPKAIAANKKLGFENYSFEVCRFSEL